jgi:acetoin utilization deacetylase AcuC-like enzyme
MPTALFTHPACLLHDNGPGHPESPERLRAILAELDKPAYKALQRSEAPTAPMSTVYLRLCHRKDMPRSIMKRRCHPVQARRLYAQQGL